MQKFLFSVLAQGYELRKAYKSRTAWTAFVLFLLTNSDQVKSLVALVVPAEYLIYLDALLAAAVVFFHVNPAQQYGAPKEPA